MSSSSDLPRLLLVGGSGGVVGRAVLPEFLPTHRIRSVHRHPVPAEATAGVEWVPADIGRIEDWCPFLEDVDVVLNLAWHRWGNTTRFRRLGGGLERLVDTARKVGVRRFLHVSVPAAPPRLEERLPYLTYKRRLDRTLAESGLSYRIVRPTMLFARGDRLLGVMLRLMRRYPLFPMFGSGRYHVSPIASADLAAILHKEASGSRVGTVDAGGPTRYEYRDLTDRMFQLLGKRPRYWHLGPTGSVALAQLVQDLGSTAIYAYEVEWLLADLLGLAPYEGLDRPLTPVEPYLVDEVARLLGHAPEAVEAPSRTRE